MISVLVRVVIFFFMVTSVFACMGNRVRKIVGAVLEDAGDRLQKPRQRPKCELDSQDKTGEANEKTSQDGTKEQQKTFQQDSIENKQKERIPEANARRDQTLENKKEQ